MPELHKPLMSSFAASVMSMAHAGEKGGVAVAVVGGLTATELAAFGGLVVAIVSAVINMLMNFYFKWKHLKLAEKTARADRDE